MRFSAYDLESRFEYVAWSWFLYGIPLVFYLISSLYVHYGGISSFTINTIIYQDPWRSITAFGVIVDLLVLNSFVALCMPIQHIYTSKILKLKKITERLSGSHIRKSEYCILNKEEGDSVRLYFIKLFFIPLVIHALVIVINELKMWPMDTISAENFLHVGVPFLSYCFLCISIPFFIIGYLFESPLLNNQIRSVDASLSGWLVCLLSYYPFWLFTEMVLGSHVPLFVKQASFDSAQIFFVLILCFVAINTWSILSMGFRCVNLTNRGIVTRGPYAYVRHPAYTSRVFFWLLAAIHFSLVVGEWGAVLTAAGFALLYIARAITEERHLVADADYRAYKKKVPYMFIPKVL